LQQNSHSLRMLTTYQVGLIDQPGPALQPPDASVRSANEWLRHYDQERYLQFLYICETDWLRFFWIGVGDKRWKRWFACSCVCDSRLAIRSCGISSTRCTAPNWVSAATTKRATKRPVTLGLWVTSTVAAVWAVFRPSPRQICNIFPQPFCTARRRRRFTRHRRPTTTPTSSRWALCQPNNQSIHWRTFSIYYFLKSICMADYI